MYHTTVFTLIQVADLFSSVNATLFTCYQVINACSIAIPYYGPSIHVSA